MCPVKFCGGHIQFACVQQTWLVATAFFALIVDFVCAKAGREHRQKHTSHANFSDAVATQLDNAVPAVFVLPRKRGNALAALFQPNIPLEHDGECVQHILGPLYDRAHL